MNHNCQRHAGDRSAPPQRQRLPEDADAQRLSTSPAATAARRSATSSCSARSTATSSRPMPGVAPQFLADFMAGHAVDWYLMSEDLPDPESRITVDGKRHRPAMAALQPGSAARPGPESMRENFRACGYPIVLSPALRQAHALASMRHGADGRRSGQGAARSVLPLVRPRQPVRRRRRLPARPRRRSTRR